MYKTILDAFRPEICAAMQARRAPARPPPPRLLGNRAPAPLALNACPHARQGALGGHTVLDRRQQRKGVAPQAAPQAARTCPGCTR